MAQHKCGYHLRNENACNWDPNFLFRINTQKGIILLMLRLYASFHVNFSYRFFSSLFTIFDGPSVRACSQELGWPGWPVFRDFALSRNPFRCVYMWGRAEAGCKYLPYEHFIPVTGIKAGWILHSYTRPQDLRSFLISKPGLKFLIWTQGKIGSGKRPVVICRLGGWRGVGEREEGEFLGGSHGFQENREGRDQP